MYINNWLSFVSNGVCVVYYHIVDAHPREYIIEDMYPNIAVKPAFLNMRSDTEKSYCIMLSVVGSNMIVYLKDGSAQTVLRAATL